MDVISPVVAATEWKAFSLMLVGMGVGFFVGLLPGIGGGATLALMLPFVFTMTPVEAFAFLLGMQDLEEAFHQGIKHPRARTVRGQGKRGMP